MAPRAIHAQVKRSAAAWLLLCALAYGCGGADDDEAAAAGAAGSNAGAGGTAAGGGVGGGGGGGGAGGGAPGAGTGGSTPAAGGGGSAPAAGTGGAGGCGSESFAAIYQDIFANPTYMCSTPVCHGRAEGQTGSVGNLELIDRDSAYADLVGVTSDGALCGDAARVRVKPGDAANSLLVQKLRADSVMCGSVMPVTGAQITDTELARITAWINTGACDN